MLSGFSLAVRSNSIFQMANDQKCYCDIAECSQFRMHQKRRQNFVQTEVCCMGVHLLGDVLSQPWLNSIQLAYDHTLAGWQSQLTARAFNKLGQYSSNSGNRACSITHFWPKKFVQVLAEAELQESVPFCMPTIFETQKHSLGDK